MKDKTSKKIVKGRIPKKPKEERLSKRITTATTKKMKEDVKEVAKKEGESVSKFVRDILIDDVSSNSVKDDVYLDTQGDLPVSDVIESGHEPNVDFEKPSHGEEKKVEFSNKEKKVEPSNEEKKGEGVKMKKGVNENKKAKESKTVAFSDENTVDVKVFEEALSYLRKAKLKATRGMDRWRKEDYKKRNVVKVDFKKDGLELFVSTEPLHAFVTFKQFYGSLTMFFNIDELYKTFSVAIAKTARFEVLDNGQVKIVFDNGYNVSIKQSEEPRVLDNFRLADFNKAGNDVFNLEIRPKTLLEIFKGTEYMMGSPDELFLNGVEIDLEGGSLVFMSTDGFRMSYIKILEAPLPDVGDPYKSTRAFFPARGIRTMIASLKKVKENVKVKLSKDKVGFLVGNSDMKIEVVYNEPDHSYPDFHRVISNVDGKKGTVIEVNTKMLYNGIKSLPPTSLRGDAVVQMSFGIDDTELKLSCNKDDYESTVSLPMELIDVRDGVDSVRIGFNYNFLMQTLKLWSSDKFYTEDSTGDVRLRFTGERDAMKMVPVGMDNVFVLIMPVRL